MAGARKGSRKAARSGSGVGRVALVYGVCITAALVAWGFLVWLAVRFGSAAMDGRTAGWGWMGLAAFGAMACLFLALLLVGRILLAMNRAPTDPHGEPAPVGGRRAAR